MNCREITCIVCPIGCQLVAIPNNDSEWGYEVSGNQCKRGIDYAKNEIINPTRVLPTTVKIRNAHLPRLPVKTDKPIPKSKIFECMKVINSIEVEAPVKMGEIIIEDILGTGANIVATRSM